ncbi:hypothetical protein D3C85_1573920 [compost metagenome]
MCELIRDFLGENQPHAEALCKKLMLAEEANQRGNPMSKNGILRAFTLELDALSGKKLTAEHANILKKLAGYL